MPGKERGPVPNVTCPPSSGATSRERFCRCHNQRRAFHATRKERTRRADRSPMLLDAAASADMLAWENSGFSIESSVRITLAVPQLRVYCQPRASVAVLCEASVCTRAALRESRRRRPHRESPLRAAAALWPAHWISQTRPDRSRPATSAPSAELARSRWDNRSALQPPAPTSRRVVQREEWAIAQEPRKR